MSETLPNWVGSKNMSQEGNTPKRGGLHTLRRERQGRKSELGLVAAGSYTAKSGSGPGVKESKSRVSECQVTPSG